MPKRRINVCLDETVYQKLVEIAKRDGLNRSAMVAVLVNEKYEKIKKNGNEKTPLPKANDRTVPIRIPTQTAAISQETCTFRENRFKTSCATLFIF